MKINAQRHFAKKQDSDKLLERINYWTSERERDLCDPIVPRSRTRVGAILEDRTSDGLRYEVELMLLTPANYHYFIKYGKLDLLIMESIWETSTGHWNLGQLSSANCRNELLEIVKIAKDKGIPTVYWFTKDSIYHDHYIDFARNFDHVFCSDVSEVKKLEADGVAAAWLPPCVQTCVHDQMRGKIEKSISVLFDGWADIDKFSEHYPDIGEMLNNGLKVIESRYQVFETRKKLINGNIDGILGSVTQRGRLMTMHSAEKFLTFDKTASTRTTQIIMTLDAIAAGLPVIHCGALEIGDPRINMVSISTPNDVLAILRSPENSKYMLPELPLENTFNYAVNKIMEEVSRC
jgi:hypothetical protein